MNAISGTGTRPVMARQRSFPRPNVPRPAAVGAAGVGRARNARILPHPDQEWARPVPGAPSWWCREAPATVRPPDRPPARIVARPIAGWPGRRPRARRHACQRGPQPRRAGRRLGRRGPRHDPGRQECGDLIGPQAGLGQDLQRVGTETRGALPVAVAGCGAQRRDHVLRGTLPDHQAAGADLGIPLGLGRGVDRGHAGVIAEMRQPGRAGPAGEDGRDVGDRRRIELARNEVLPFDRPAEGNPERRLQGADGEERTVGGRVDRVAGVGPGQRTGAGAGRREACAQGSQPAHDRVEHRNVQHGALAGALAAEERRQDLQRGQRAAGEVGHLQPRRDGPCAGRAKEGQQAADRKVVQVVSRAVTIRPILPKPRERAVDDAGVHGQEVVRPKAAPGDLAGHRRLQEDVGVTRQAQDHVPAPRQPVVDGDAPLAAVDGLEDAAEAKLGRGDPGVVAGEQRLDLDDLGAEVRQEQ